MFEIACVVEELAEGGYMARALGTSIFTEANTEAELRCAVRDAVNCHFEASNLPKAIRLYFVREEMMCVQARPSSH